MENENNTPKTPLVESMILENADLVSEIKSAQSGPVMSADEFLKWLSEVKG